LEFSYNLKRVIFRFRGKTGDARIYALLSFFVSGCIHEYVCWASWRISRGENLAFFMISAIACMIQQIVESSRMGKEIGRGLHRVVPGVVLESISILVTQFLFANIGVLFVGPYVESNMLRRSSGFFGITFPWAK
jgi:hypothetical protein